MDGPVIVGLDRPESVDRLADEIENPSQRGLAHRHVHRRAGIDALHAADHAVGVAQGHAADPAAAEVLLHFAGQIELDSLLIALDLDGVVNRRQLIFGKLDVESRADDLADAAYVLFLGGFGWRWLWAW